MRKEKKTKKKNLKKTITTIVVILILLSTITYAAYVLITTTWISPSSIPSATLLHPDDDESFNVNTTYFTWSGIGDVEHPLWYVWYADTNDTFTTPNLRIIDVNTSLNYTADPFEDGDWYWRVEVTDNSTQNVSSTRHFVIQTNASNHFPYLTNPQVFPTSGYIATVFYYNVTFNDADNNTAAIMNVTIDGTQYAMTETDISDTNTTDGKNYTYSTTLAVGNHNYSFICFDGTATNTTGIVYDPTVAVSNPPILSNPNPANNSIDNSLAFTWSISITDDVSTINWTIECSNNQSNSSNDDSNGIKNLSLTNLSCSTEYTVWVNATDDEQTIGKIYYFNTVDCVSLSNEYPLNNSVDICPCASPLGFDIKGTSAYFNITVFGREINTTYWHVWNRYFNVTNNTYAFCLCEGYHVPAYCYLHTNYSKIVASAGTWYDIYFIDEADHLRKNINWSVASNNTIKILSDGVYRIAYRVSCEDSSATPTSEVYTRILVNNVESHGSLQSKGMNNKNDIASISAHVVEQLYAGDIVKLQFTGDSTTIKLASHTVYGDIHTSAFININKLSYDYDLPFKFNTTYEWYIFAEDYSNNSLTTNTSIYEFTTAWGVTNCSTGEINTYGYSPGTSGIIGLMGLLSLALIPILLRKKKEKE